MTKQGITFDEICDLEPEIRRLYRLAKMIGRRRGVAFDSNAIWYTFFKPVVVCLIGWNRRPSKASDFRFISAGELVAANRTPPRNPVIPITASRSTDPRLKTPEAYNVVYQTISAALPD